MTCWIIRVIKIFWWTSVILSFSIDFRHIVPDYSDSEDDGPIPYKSDEEDQHDDELARKIARRDTIAREKEISELKQKANSKDMQTRKNDVSFELSEFWIIRNIFEPNRIGLLGRKKQSVLYIIDKYLITVHQTLGEIFSFDFI